MREWHKVGSREDMKRKLDAEIQGGRCMICRLDRQAPEPFWAKGDFISITRTRDECSIVCEEGESPDGIDCEKGWRCMKIVGPLDFSLTGILASPALPFV